MEVQKCESSFCLGTNLNSTSINEQDDDCPICMTSLKGKEIVMLQGCDHIGCSSCIKNWVELKRSRSCPLCRSRSGEMIFSKSIFKAEEKLNLFSKHSDCYLNDSQFDAIKPFLAKVNNQDWRTFIKCILTSKYRQPVYYDIDDFRYFNGARPTHIGAKFATFRIKSFNRAIICLPHPGIDIQMALTNEEFEYGGCDSKLGDKYVNYLNQQWIHSWQALPHVLNHEIIVMARKFDDLHCLLKLETYEKGKVEYVESEVTMKGQMSQLPFSNIRRIKCKVDLYELCDRMFLFE